MNNPKFRKRIFKAYSIQEEEFIRENYGKLPSSEIEIALCRKSPSTHNAGKNIQAKAKSMGLSSNLYRTSFLGRRHSKKTLQKMSKIKLERKNPFWNKQHSSNHKSVLRKISTSLWKKPSWRKKTLIGLLKAVKSSTHREKLKKKSKSLWKKKDYRDKVTKAIREGLKQKPTLPERQLMQMIKLHNLPFSYTGDGKEFIGGFNPDFFSKNLKLIIEVYGNYWHNPHKFPHTKNTHRRRRKTYGSLGYKLLVLWEKELNNNPQKVVEKVVNFIL